MKFLLTYCCLVALKVLKATYVSTKQRGGENWFFEWLNINFMSMKTTTTKYFHNAEKLGKAKTKKLNLNQDHMQHNNLRQDHDTFKKSTQMGLYWIT
jgi:hypothetical protein